MDSGTANALARGLVGGIMLLGFVFCAWLIKNFFVWLLSLLKGK